MKKLFCLLLCPILLLCAGCGKKKTEKKYTTDVDIEYYVRQGQLPECGKYTLGYDVDALTEELNAEQSAAESGEAHSEDEDDAFFWFENEQPDYTGLRTGSAEYCFKADKRSDGISAIVSFNTAFGFEAGTISIEVKEALSDFNAEEAAGGKGLPFLSTDDETEYLTYKFADRCVTFAFYENALCGAAVYASEDWSIK